MARCASIGKRLAMVLLLAAAGTGTSHAYRVVVDPGHGGPPDEPGCGSGATFGTCAEKTVNVRVATVVNQLLVDDPSFEPTVTRSLTADDCVSLATRVDISNALNADAFVSIHHDQAGVSRVFVMYCNTLRQADTFEGGVPVWQLSSEMGQIIADELDENYAGPLADIHGDGLHEDDSVVAHLFVLKWNTQRAVLGEGGGMDQQPVQAICSGTDPDSALQREALGYYEGIANTFGVVSVGTSFAATGNGNNVILTWEESEPERWVTYYLYRSDSCWGPFAEIAAIESHDPAYTPDDVHYTYVDPVNVDQAYHYQLHVTGEVVRASGTPTGNLPYPDVPSVPANLVATAAGDAVDLSWTASSGNVDGYHVFRSIVDPLSSCTSNYSYVASTTTPMYQDAAALAGYEHYYRVRAFNAYSGSPVSNQAGASTTTAVDDIDEALGMPVRLAIRVPDIQGGEALTLRLEMPAADAVRVEVFDVRGRLLATVHDGRLPRGHHVLQWGRTTNRGDAVGSGVYLVRAATDHIGRVARKVVVVP